jgi:hypothetical protein
VIELDRTEIEELEKTKNDIDELSAKESVNADQRQGLPLVRR